MQYNEYIDARDADKEAAELFAETSKQTVAELAMEKFTNIQNQWDNAVYQNEQKETSLNNSMEINRGNGNKRLNQKVYASLITNEEAKRNNLISLFSKPISFIFFQSQTLNPIQNLIKFL